MPTAKIAKAQANEFLEQKLWKAADKLRKNIDAAEYKHIALGLIFLKYISDAFEELHEKLVAGVEIMRGLTRKIRRSMGGECLFCAYGGSVGGVGGADGGGVGVG